MMRKGIFLQVSCLTAFLAGIVAGQIYINKTPLNKKRGECVTFKAAHYYNLPSNATFTWSRYAVALPQGTFNSTTVNKDTMTISNLVTANSALYQAEVRTEGGKEVTRYWLTVKGCDINEKQTSFDECKIACKETCSAGWYHFNGKCYKYYSTPKSWEDAHTFCQANSAKLATIDDASENSLVGNLLMTGDGAWIGLNDKSQESNYIWSYNKYAKPSFFAWDKSNPRNPEPNNNNDGCNIENCVEFKWKTKKWNDAVCNAQFEFICEVFSDKDIPGWQCTGGKCYNNILVKMAWVEAQRECTRNMNATLVTIRSSSENAVIGKMIQSSVWIGLNDRAEAGVYVWNDIGVDQFSHKASYFNWDIGEPNDKLYNRLLPRCTGEDCVRIKKWNDVVSWSDMGCNTALPYVCEKSRDLYLGFAAWIAISMGAGLVVSIVAARGYMELKSKRGKKDVKQMISEVTSRSEKT